MVQESISNEELERYSRQIALEDIGFDGQFRLKKSRVCLVGVGGLGAPTALKLTSMGVGFIRLVDRDVISKSDLHRQYLYDLLSIGKPKVEAAKKKLKRLNDLVEIDARAEPLAPYNVDELIKDVDLVIDGLDSIEGRYILNEACVRLGKPYLFSAAIEMFGNVSTLIPYKTPCLECFYSGLKDEGLERCAVVGVHPSVLSIISSIQVAEAISILTGKEPKLTNKLLYIDLRNMTFETLSINRNPNCRVCSEKAVSYKKEIPVVQGGCGRDGRGIFLFSPNKTISLNLRKIKNSLQEKNFHIVSKGSLGITFDYNKDIRISLLKSGASILQSTANSGIRNEEEALKTYRKISNEIPLPKL
ncbi:MAG: HesA/MoeB/ThiF family protein [Nitrososphaerales archaeon]